MLDKENINILKLRVEYILTLNNEALDIMETLLSLLSTYELFNNIFLE